MDANYSGSHNAGGPMLLDSALEWVQMSLSSKDMDHRETMLTNARFIAACYGTPPQLVNIPGESTYSNYQQATMAYWGDTVLPLLGILLEDINRWLPPCSASPRSFLWYDEEQIPALEPRRKEKSDRINAALYMTYDEKREAMGLEAYTPPASPAPTACSSRPTRSRSRWRARSIRTSTRHWPRMTRPDPAKPKPTPDPKKPPEGGQETRPARTSISDEAHDQSFQIAIPRRRSARERALRVENEGGPLASGKVTEAISGILISLCVINLTASAE